MSTRSFFFILFTLFLLGNSAYSQYLNPGDGIRITFYNISDQITGDYFIQENGKVQLPFIGLISTENRDFEIIRQEIFTAYDSLYRDPELTIQPLFKIKILGEVRDPGVFYVTGVETLSDLLALAGGETEDANLKKIYFVQKNNKLNVNAREMLEKGKMVTAYGLKSGTQIYVPKKWFNFRKASIIFSGLAVTATIVGLALR